MRSDSFCQWRARWLCFLCLLSLIVARDLAHVDAATDDVHAAASALNIVQEILERGSIPGMSAAVARDGKIVWSEALGFADIESTIPATRETKVRVGSVSKVFTAAAAAKLEEAGQLDLDSPVRRYIPEFPDKGTAVSVRQLAGHLSGIRHYAFGEDDREAESLRRHYDDVIAALDIFKDDPLVHAPGERHLYSSFGYVLLSAVEQRASGKSFLALARETVFKPLSMQHTFPDDVTKPVRGRSTFYVGSTAPAPPIDVSYKWGAGGFLSTAEDLVRFGSAHLPDSMFFRPETLSILFTRNKTNDGREGRHGIGWVIDELESGEPVYYHGGDVVGGHAILLIRPEKGIVVALVANRSSYFGEAQANQIANVFCGLVPGPQIKGLAERRASNREAVAKFRRALETWGTSLEGGDLNRHMGVYSPDFKSQEWKDKAEMQSYWKGLLNQNALKLNTDNGHVQIRGFDVGSQVWVSGLSVEWPSKTMSIVVTFTRAEDGWKVSEIKVVADPEGRQDR